MAYSIWVFDFVQERFHNASPGDFEIMFIKAGTVKQGRAYLGQKKQQERAWVRLLWFTGKSEKRGPLRQVQGVAWDELQLPIALLGASLVGSLSV